MASSANPYEHTNIEQDLIDPDDGKGMLTFANQARNTDLQT
jgi:hypothetical protein